MSTTTPWPPKTEGMTIAELLRQRIIARDYLEHLEKELIGKPQKAAREESGIPADDDDRMGGACFSPEQPCEWCEIIDKSVSREVLQKSRDCGTRLISSIAITVMEKKSVERMGNAMDAGSLRSYRETPSPPPSRNSKGRNEKEQRQNSLEQ